MKKNTKKSLLFSVLALVLCVAMLAGSTLAWFTDSVTTGVNKIEAGNLDIELEYSKSGTGDWNKVQGATELFKDVSLWEPGATSVVYLKLSNKGSLDLKYRFAMKVSDETPGTNVDGDSFKLSDYLQFSVIEGNTVYATRDAARNAAGQGIKLSSKNGEGRAHDEVGTMTAGPNAVRNFALVVFMPETVGNKANYRGTAPTIDLGLELTATQLASEKDSFDNQYDYGANAGGDYMGFASATVTAPAESQSLEIVLNNNAPVSGEKSTTLTMENIPDTLAGKKVEFTATTYNASAAQNEPNFNIATGNNTEVAALQLDLKVDGQSANQIDATTPRTVTTYIATGLTGVKVFYVAENGNKTEITSVDYDEATGKLVFTTNHFSDYVVTAQALSETEGTEGVYEIKTAADLFAFARLVNVKGQTFAGKTVKLMADIDLARTTWEPVGQTGATQFQGIFDGQGHTIKNMTVDNPSENQHVSSGFFGWLENTAGVKVQNVNFENAKVTGSHYVGVVAGYLSGTISNCKVTNCEVIGVHMNDDANGDKVGGIVGFVNAGNITGNKVVGGSISGNRDVGGIVGAVVTGVDSFTGNRVKDTTITYKTDKSYASAGAIVSGRTGFAPDESNTATNVTVAKAISTADELSAALNKTYTSNTIIKLMNDITLSGEWGVHTLEGSSNANLTIDGNGKTIYGLTSNEYNNINGFNSNGLVTAIKSGLSSVTFKNLTVSGATLTNNGGWNAASGVFVGDINTVKVTFDTCTVTGATVTSNAYAAGFVGYVQDVYCSNPDLCCPITLKNCTVTGSSFTGSDATGAMVGLNNGSTTINGATVTGNTIDGSAGYSAAALVGTSVNGTTATGVTASGNTFTNTGTKYQVYNATYGYVYKNGQTYSVNGTELG